jgi:uncharacterized protein YggT (Ycf19 family)
MAHQRTTERGDVHRDESIDGVPEEVTTEATRTITTDPYSHRRDAAWRAAQLVWLVFGAGVALIAIRFVLLLLGANPDAGFTDFVYTITNPLVRPFEGIFGAPDLETGVLDPASLVAIVVYSLLAWVAATLVDIVAGESRSADETRSSSIDREYR